jgi:hypothetical protein
MRPTRTWAATMSVTDYKTSLTLSAEPANTFEVLIMTAIRRGHSGQIAAIEAAFPEIFAEYKYRHWSGGGLMPGEPGYDPVTDDNLSPIPRDEGKSSSMTTNPNGQIPESAKNGQDPEE